MYNVIAFDADDTLWHNEHIFLDVQDRFCEMLVSHSPSFIQNILTDIHIRNIEIYGYGIKGFILSMVETFIEIQEGKVNGIEVKQILDFGREMLAAPITLLPNVFDVLMQLSEEYSLMIITKGDLIDQEKKIARSGLYDFFKKIEIVSDKTEISYKKILNRNKIDVSHFLMVGNSMRSDIVPVVKIGASAVHIPYKTTWVHEEDYPHLDLGEFFVLEKIALLPDFLNSKK
tara:strand:+ start:2357 stop:3046 length:690 start_codon:yes stop_codon:yes gene_type:complete